MKLVKCDIIVQREGSLVSELLTHMSAPDQENLRGKVDAWIETRVRQQGMTADKYRLVYWKITQDTEFQSPKDLLSLIDFKS